MPKPSAYTLLECLLVVAIISILTVSALPSFISWYRLRNERAVSQLVVSAIQYAKQQADVDDMPVVVCPYKHELQCGDNWLQGLLVFKDEFDDGRIHNKQQVLVVVNLPVVRGRLVWQGYPYYYSYLRFVPNDWSEGMNGAFRFYRAYETDVAWSIVVNKEGGVRVVG